jgi:simple sugar transport system permease protein
MESLTVFILQQTAMSATPLLFAGFGELVAQRAGVINVGIEGMMLMGAITAFGAAVTAGSASVALPAAAGVGLAMGALFALVVVWLRADQIVTGTAMNLLAAGASTTLWRMLQTYMGNGHDVPPLFERWTTPGLARVTLAGPPIAEILNQYVLFHVMVPVGILLWLVMRNTRTGLIVRSLGDAPDACDAAGIRVRWWRTGLLLFAGMMAGVAGAYFSTMRGHTFQINMTNGQGFLVLALVIFGRWNILGFSVGTLAFGAVDAVQHYLAATPAATTRIPHQVFDMLPYAATLVALGILTRGRSGPAYLGRAWPE